MTRLLTSVFFTVSAFAQSDFAVHLANDYTITPNITYVTANNYESKLDVWARRGATTPQPDPDLDSWRRMDRRDEGRARRRSSRLA